MKTKKKANSSKEKKNIDVFESDKSLNKQKVVFDSILSAFDKNKTQSLISLIENYLQKINKSKFSKQLGISRATLYDMLNGNKNPTLRIFVECVHQILLDMGMKKPLKASKAKKSNSSIFVKTAKSKELILEAVVNIFRNNDFEPVIEIIRAYLQSKNKSLFAKNVGISRATLYDMLNGKKNPTLWVFMQCIHVMIH